MFICLDVSHLFSQRSVESRLYGRRGTIGSGKMRLPGPEVGTQCLYAMNRKHYFSHGRSGVETWCFNRSLLPGPGAYLDPLGG